MQLQNFEPEITQAWQLICDVSRKGLIHKLLYKLSIFLDYTEIYKRLDVTLTERGESFYQNRMVEVIQLMEEKG